MSEAIQHSIQIIKDTSGRQVCCFGELLLRISPVLSNRQWIHTNTFPVFIGGAELNVARALAVWEIPTKYTTALPDSYLSTDIITELQEEKIDTATILSSGERIGTYYLPQGSDLKHAAVIYDRAHSAFYDLKPGMIDWDEVLNGCSWFHFSAISPAINRQTAAVCKEALMIAEKKGLMISTDLNFRGKLWKYGSEPIEIMPDLVEHCHLIMGNIWAAEKLLGIKIEEEALGVNYKDGNIRQSFSTAQAVFNKYPKAQVVANTFRFDKLPTGIHYYTTLHERDGENIQSGVYEVEQVVDKIGSGDCFMAGLIYGVYHQHNPQQTLDFATAAAFGKLQEKGDMTKQTVAEIEKIIVHT